MLETQPDSPYRGLVPYREEDAPFFRGRKDETRLVIANLCAAPLTLFYGPSGVGKSSVLRAGVLPGLRAHRSVLCVYFNRWKEDPVAGLKATVAEAVAGAGAGDAPAVDPGLPLENYLTRHALNIKRRLVIILDQFEEYFLYRRQGEADNFAAEFPAAVVKAAATFHAVDAEDSLTGEAPDTSERVRAQLGFLISIRDDVLSQLDYFERDIPNIFDNYLRIEHLDGEAARAAIIEPLAVYNARLAPGAPKVDYEPDLVVAVLSQLSDVRGPLDDVAPNVSAQKRERALGGEVGGPAGDAPGGRPKALKDLRIIAPYLQLVLTRLWDEAAAAQPPVLRLATLKKLGGVRKIIDAHLDKALRALGRGQRRLASRVFYFLVSPSGTKYAYTADDLAEQTGISPRRVARLLERLATPDLRLLNSFETGTPATSGVPIDENRRVYYEIYHDFLAQPILAWRARHLLYERLLVLQLFWLLPAFVGGFLLALLFILPPRLMNLSDLLFRAILYSIIFTIPAIVGILIGRAWARVR